jgi:hypothetical protein
MNSPRKNRIPPRPQSKTWTVTHKTDANQTVSVTAHNAVDAILVAARTLGCNPADLRTE